MAGCAMNNVIQLPSGSPVAEERAIVAYGVRVEGNWKYPGFSVQLDEYDVRTQAITGNCFRFNKAAAMVSATVGATQYFAFEVPPGHYVYSWFNRAQLEHDTIAYAAPKGRILYVGEFIYSRDQIVVVRRDIDEFKAAIPHSLPDLKGEIFLAEAVKVQRPRGFLCAP